jgi:Peptidase family M1 domain
LTVSVGFVRVPVRRRLLSWIAVLLAACVAAGIASSGASPAAAAQASCLPGAHTLASYGSRLYPEMGNGGYTSLHTELDLRYDTASDEFLEGNHVALTDRADQCLSSFSLDFERKSADKRRGPDMRVESVEVDGRPARFTFVQPTYPGDPNGQQDPDPRAHEASEEDPVGGPEANPLPPACTPELASEKENRLSLDGRPCPANKLLIRPPADIPKGSKFTVTVFYSGRPGVHDDGEGGVDGWFRAPDGGFVDTEPVGAEDWMPLNNYPSAKPTYTFHETVPTGRVAVANGMLTGTTRNPPDAQFPGGSVTWNWDSPAPIASYLVQSSIGRYELTKHLGADGIVYYEVQDKGVGRRRKRRNQVVMNTQEQVTKYESRFNGPFPFTSDGSLIGTVTVELGQEEMQTMISFTEGRIQPVVLWHENMHQWWGDNVTEAGYGMTFFKEGLAEWMEEFVFPAHELGRAAFNASLAKEFDMFYARKRHFWTTAPSDPYAYNLFETPNTYARPAAAYEALRRILGGADFADALQQIQRRYGASSITEPELEAGFDRWLPDRSADCEARLGQFFDEWFDTAYPPGGGKNRPHITGPGLEGEEFYGGGCPRGVGRDRNPGY